jgi:hypothetical protein
LKGRDASTKGAMPPDPAPPSCEPPVPGDPPVPELPPEPLVLLVVTDELAPVLVPDVVVAAVVPPDPPLLQDSTAGSHGTASARELQPATMNQPTETIPTPNETMDP